MATMGKFGHHCDPGMDSKIEIDRLRDGIEVLKGKLENLRDMASFDAFAGRNGEARECFSAGREFGLNEALKAIDAWESGETRDDDPEGERAGKPLIDVLTD